MHMKRLMNAFGKLALAAAFAGAWSGDLALAQAVAVEKVTAVASLPPAPMSTGGRMMAEDAGEERLNYRYQWPGTYFEAAFEGSAICFAIGPGDEILHVRIDDQPPVRLVRPAAGFYRLGGISLGRHAVRIEVATESQAAPGNFGGFALPADARALPPPKRSRQIEFIGDSHTVGYGNTSRGRKCTPEEVWTTTDNSAAFGALTARHYEADYQINAISGRGIVRNYGGGPGDPLPIVYPYVLFDKATVFQDQAWRPQIVVIDLGSNDFSTPLNPGERWKSREELHADFEASYGRFVQTIRAKNGGAFFILLTTGASDEIQAEVRKVVGQLTAAGEGRIAFIPVDGLSLTGCDWHPSTADDRKISDALVRFIDANPRLWQGK